MYAVVAINGHQWIVKKGDEIVVDRIDAEEGASLDYDTVLCSFDEAGEKVAVGAPYINAKVKAKVVTHQQGDKIKVVKFQSKKRYHKNKGFRPKQTVLAIEGISVDE